MSHGPQHFESNNWQGKGCRSVCRITINLAWPEQNPFLGSTGRNKRQDAPVPALSVEVVIRLLDTDHLLDPDIPVEKRSQEVIVN